MLSEKVQKRFKGTNIGMRCATDCKAIAGSILSQSIAHAETNGWALGRFSMWWIAFVLMCLPRRWLL
eukprot:4276220-Karenia_brevis.AAC.1